ncbi:hypothetical protein [Arthrobacter sp. SX1312]|uniref:hypothetical protein n=1 Tax=Arthrobacter sp. SX1312 TaxID=2058896 RepID=UPI000CE35162|nr:hypothetical protein [Arthrobacter sp. SX1312]
MIITVDDLAKVTEAVTIGKRTLRIALQSIGIGIALSLVLMTGAALGLVPPTGRRVRPVGASIS